MKIGIPGAIVISSFIIGGALLLSNGGFEQVQSIYKSWKYEMQETSKIKENNKFFKNLQITVEKNNTNCKNGSDIFFSVTNNSGTIVNRVSFTVSGHYKNNSRTLYYKELESDRILQSYGQSYYWCLTPTSFEKGTLRKNDMVFNIRRKVAYIEGGKTMVDQ